MITRRSAGARRWRCSNASGSSRTTSRSSHPASCFGQRDWAAATACSSIAVRVCGSATRRATRSITATCSASRSPSRNACQTVGRSAASLRDRAIRQRTGYGCCRSISDNSSATNSPGLARPALGTAASCRSNAVRTSAYLIVISASLANALAACRRAAATSLPTARRSSDSSPITPSSSQPPRQNRTTERYRLEVPCKAESIRSCRQSLIRAKLPTAEPVVLRHVHPPSVRFASAQSPVAVWLLVPDRRNTTILSVCCRPAGTTPAGLSWCFRGESESTATDEQASVLANVSGCGLAFDPVRANATSGRGRLLPVTRLGRQRLRVAGNRPAVSEAAAHRDEFQICRRRMQRDLEPAEGAAVERERLLICGEAVLPNALAAGAHDVLSDAGGGLGPIGGSLRLSLVVVLMAGEKERDAAADQRGVDRLELRSIGVAPTRFVHVRQDAALGVRGQVALQPLDLTAARRDVTLGVQLHDMPVTEIERAVALRRAPRQGAEVGVVARGAGRLVVLIAWGGSGGGLEAAVRGLVRGPEVGQVAVVVLEIPQCEKCRWPSVDDRAGHRLVLTGSGGDRGTRLAHQVTHCRDDRISARRWLNVSDSAVTKTVAIATERDRDLRLTGGTRWIRRISSVVGVPRLVVEGRGPP